MHSEKLHTISNCFVALIGVSTGMADQIAGFVAFIAVLIKTKKFVNDLVLSYHWNSLVCTTPKNKPSFIHQVFVIDTIGHFLRYLDLKI